MQNKLELAQDKFLGGIGKLAGSFGLNDFTAKLYAVLYLSDKPLSLDDLVDRLKASKGNVSINIRELERWGAVKSVWVKGSRKDYYECDPDIKKLLINKIRSGAQKRIEQVSGMIGEFKQFIDSDTNGMTDEDRKMAKVYHEKLAKIEEITGMASNMLSLAEKFL